MDTPLPKILTPEEIDRTIYRPLWWGVFNPPKELYPMTEPWRIRLLELGLLDIYSSHMALVAGSALSDHEKLQSEVDLWAAEAGARGSSGVEYVNLEAEIVEPPNTAARPTLRMLADVPIEDEAEDLLGLRAYAYALAGLIDNPETRTPLTLAINAPWGAGKTSLARMIKTILERKPEDNKERPHVTCWFDAWMHDDAPNLASSLAAAVAKRASSHRPIWSRLLRPVPATLSRGGAWESRLFAIDVLLLIGVVSECIFPRLGFALLDALKLDPKAFWTFQEAFGTHIGPYVSAAILAVWSAIQIVRQAVPLAKPVAEFVKNPQASARSASINEVGGQLSQLIRQATPKGSRFVIFIDDLERCRPPRAVDVLEVVNQLLNHQGVVTVVMGDMAAIARCAEVKYKELVRPKAASRRSAGGESQQSYGREYLDKIIQLQFDLPPYSAATIQDLMGKIVGRGQLGSRAKVPVIVRLLAQLASRPTAIWHRRAVARARDTIAKELDAQDSSGQKDFAAIRGKVVSSLQGTLPPQAVEDLTRQGIQRRLGDEARLMEQAREFLGYLELYPRHAKRFLNRLRLLLYIAHERGVFGGEPPLTPRHVAKWAVLCERWPLLAVALSTHPHMMIHLERGPAMSEGQRKNHVDPLSWLAPEYMGDSWLPAFLGSEPKMARVIARLVRFEPATQQAATRQDAP